MSQAKHTQFAMKALDLAEMFRLMVGQKPVQGPTPFRVELGTPDGPSTGGGVQALQAIKLVPENGTGATVVAGHANKTGGKAELRTYECLAQQHAQRFKGAPFPIPKENYDELFQRLEKFFKDQSLTVEKVDAAPVSMPPEFEEMKPTTESSSLWKWVVAVLALVGAAAWVMLRR